MSESLAPIPIARIRTAIAALISSKRVKVMVKSAPVCRLRRNAPEAGTGHRQIGRPRPTRPRLGTPADTAGAYDTLPQRANQRTGEQECGLPIPARHIAFGWIGIARRHPHGCHRPFFRIQAALHD
ncbi:hypothetical protein MesoLjLb_48200 [Mesorhizobium sp. L-8-3]|nr:hypothetical protein MesoLjLb_48200 [Mesorhizobium sp. L-8-3]